MSDAPCFMIANFVVHDADTYRKYEKGFFPILKRHGGEFFTYDDKSDTLEGSSPRPGRIVMFKFPSEENARAWWADPTTRPCPSTVAQAPAWSSSRSSMASATKVGWRSRPKVLTSVRSGRPGPHRRRPISQATAPSSSERQAANRLLGDRLPARLRSKLLPSRQRGSKTMRPHIIKVSEHFWNIRGSFKIGGLIDIGTQASLVRRTTAGSSFSIPMRSAARSNARCSS